LLKRALIFETCLQTNLMLNILLTKMAVFEKCSMAASSPALILESPETSLGFIKKCFGASEK
jgi:hypothetical protein